MSKPRRSAIGGFGSVPSMIALRNPSPSYSRIFSTGVTPILRVSSTSRSIFRLAPDKQHDRSIVSSHHSVPTPSLHLLAPLADLAAGEIHESAHARGVAQVRMGQEP